MNKRGTLLIFSAAVLWGTAGVFVRALTSVGLSNMQVVFNRAIITTAIMCAVCLVKDRALFKVKLRDLPLFAASGILSVVFFNYCYYKTIELSTLSVASVLMYTAPIFVMLMAIPLFKESLSVRKCVALTVAFVGCIFVSGAVGAGQKIGTAAVIYGLMTGFGYSLYTVFGNILLKKGYSSFTITLYSFMFSALGSAPLMLASGGIPFTQMGGRAWLVAVGMAVFNTVLPYLFYTSGLKTVEVSHAPIIATVEPVTATVIGIFYNDPLDIYGLLGIALVLGSVVILNLKVRDKNEADGKCKN